MYNMDIKVLKIGIMDAIDSIPMVLQWKMISLGIQGPVKLEEQVKVLHIYVDEMDVTTFGYNQQSPCGLH